MVTEDTSAVQTDRLASFIRAARAGNLEKVKEYLKGSIDVNGSNVSGMTALHVASKEGHTLVVAELLKHGADINVTTVKGNTPLHIASLGGKEEVVKLLISNGANVNAQSAIGFTPLYMAAQENHVNVVRMLLANGANPALATEEGFTPFAVAVQQGHSKVVELLLENDTSRGKIRLPALHVAAKRDDCKAAALLLQNDHPDVTSKSDFTPLHIAAHYGNENIAIMLLDKNADVNFPAKHQITPLHVAAKWGKANMVALLLSKNARIDASTRDGLTPLHCAARSGHEGVVDLLLQKKAPISAKTKNGLSALHMAAQGDHVECARTLLHYKAPVDDVTVDYLTALHIAAHYGNVRVAKLLLDRKTDPNARALNGFTPLHIACKKGRIKVVELLLQHGASIEATTESGLTPLHVAAFMGCMNIVIYLIQRGANPNAPTVRGETPLHLAARANQADIIRILLRNGADVNAKAREQQTALHIASRLGNVDIVSILLQHGAAVDAVTKDSYTALHIAAKEGQEEVASLLLDQKANLTATTKKGFTPLHLAAKYGNIKVARLLLAKEAPVDAQGKNGVTPLHVAAHYDHADVALLLLEKRASPHAAAKNGYCPLHIAAKKNQMDIATSLLEYGAKANAESKAGFTPLHLACQEGHTDMASLLIRFHADVNAGAKNGLTPLHLCAQEDRVAVAAVLVKAKCKVDAKTKAGYTPLHVACHFGNGNMVRFLLSNGADVNAVTTHGYTPLHQSAQQGHKQIVNLLLDHKASPNVVTNQGQTALAIAQKLGYISVVETLRVVTETIVTTTTTTVTEEKYKLVAPETMHETFITDSEDEAADDHMLGDQSTYKYLTADEMKSLGDDSMPMDVTRDEHPEHKLPHRDMIAPLQNHHDEHTISHADMLKTEAMVGSLMPDNIEIKRPVAKHSLEWRTFLVSFMVDARGGAMRGCRHSGVRVLVPPYMAPMPMRITCRYIRKEKLISPPRLAEEEKLASRILEMGPTGARFLGPVVIEVPHFASLRGGEREIIVLRSDDGETWTEHTMNLPADRVQEILKTSLKREIGGQVDSEFSKDRIVRIVTTDFPHYFAVVTRLRYEAHIVGSNGGMINSSVVPHVQVIFPKGSLNKETRVGLRTQTIPPEIVAKVAGNGVAVSPILTVEPRRRLFHKPIIITIPLPEAATKGMINQYNGEAPTLRMLCSMAGPHSKSLWEDITGSTPFTFLNDCVSFETNLSARFWLIDCRQEKESVTIATDIYRHVVPVPYMAKFVVFAKRYDPAEAQLRVFCMTDDKEEKTLEHQERFEEIAKSKDVEVLEGREQFVEFAGNLSPITKSGEQLSLGFQAFRENRLPFLVRVRDPHQDPAGRIAFMKDPRRPSSDLLPTPICNLNLVLPNVIEPSGDSRKSTPSPYRSGTLDEYELSGIANAVALDWVALAQELDLPEQEISHITSSKGRPEEQAVTALKTWQSRLNPYKNPRGLMEKALKAIRRDDLVAHFLRNGARRDASSFEKAIDAVGRDQEGFESLREELGSRGPSAGRDLNLDEDKDFMKDPESLEESDSDSGKKGTKSLKTPQRDQVATVTTEIKHASPESPGFEEEEVDSRHRRQIFESQQTHVVTERAIAHDTNEPEELVETRYKVTETVEHSANGVKHTVTQQTRTNLLQEEEQPSRPYETETWQSGEQDTSQVSISSLPEDERSEPTTATVSSATTTTSGEFNLSTAVVSNITEDPNIEQRGDEQPMPFKSEVKLTIQPPSMAVSPSPIRSQLTTEKSEELPDSPVIKSLPLKAMHLKQTDSTEINESPATKASPPEVVDVTRLQEHELSPVVEYGGNLGQSHQARVGVSPTEMNRYNKESGSGGGDEEGDEGGYENTAFAGTETIDLTDENTSGAVSPYEVDRKDYEDEDKPEIEKSAIIRPSELTSGERKSNNGPTSNVISPESDLTPVRATVIAQDIVEKVIEEAKVRSNHSSPAHSLSKKQEEICLSSPGPSLKEAQALAQDIVQNVIEEVKSKFASDLTLGEHVEESPTIQLRSPKRKEVKITRTEASGDTSGTERESGSEDVNYYSDGKSPAYSRPTSGELDINLFLGTGTGSSQGAGSSEYETCVTSQSTTTFKSAVTSQDTSYTTARSSLSSQQSSRGSTLIEDSESSGHLGEASSEASETLITEDRDVNTPMNEELEDEISDPTALLVGPLDRSIPQRLQLLRQEDPSARSQGRGEEETSISEASAPTWYTSNIQGDDLPLPPPPEQSDRSLVLRQVPGGPSGQGSTSGDAFEGQISAQQVTSPQEGSIGSIDLPSGASLPSYSSISSNLSERTRLQLLCDLSPESPARSVFAGDGDDRPVSPIPPDVDSIILPGSGQHHQNVQHSQSSLGQITDLSPCSDDTDNMCLGPSNELYTHPEVDEDEESSSKMDRPSSVDPKIKAKYRLSGSFADSASTSSSLQEFERLECELMMKGSNLSLSSTPQRTPQKGKSNSTTSTGNEKDVLDLSVSLCEFENLEKECQMASEKTSPLVEQKLCEIEEGHESQASDSGETLTGQDSESVRTRISNVNALLPRDDSATGGGQSLDLSSDTEDSGSENALAGSNMDTSQSSLQDQLTSLSFCSGAPSLEPVPEKVEDEDDADDPSTKNTESTSPLQPGPYAECMLASVTSVDTTDALNSSFISQGTMVSSSEIVDFPQSQPKLLITSTHNPPELHE